MSLLTELLIKITADGKGVESGVNKAMLDFKRLGATVAGFAGLGGLGYMAKQAMDNATELEHLSERTGVGVEKLQELKYAAERTGASIDEFTIALKKLAVAQVAAVNDPTGKEMRAFARFNVSLDDLRSKRPDQLFEQMSRAVKGTALTSQNTADAITLMGRSADQVLPAMRKGMDEFADAARKAGRIIEADVIKRLADANRQVESAKAKIAPGVAGGLAGLIQGADFLSTSGAYVWAGLQAAFGSRKKEMVRRAAQQQLWTDFYSRWHPGASDEGGAPIADSDQVDETMPQHGAARATGAHLRMVSIHQDALSHIGLYRGGFNQVEATREQTRVLARIEQKVNRLEQHAAALILDTPPALPGIPGLQQYAF